MNIRILRIIECTFFFHLKCPNNEAINRLSKDAFFSTKSQYAGDTLMYHKVYTFLIFSFYTGIQYPSLIKYEINLFSIVIIDIDLFNQWQIVILHNECISNV